MISNRRTRRGFWIGLTLAALLGSGLKSTPSYAEAVDLHAHLFMKQGMGWIFRGSFDEPLRARNWQAFFSSTINEESLEKSGLKLVVVALYANPLFVGSLKDAIRTQITMAENFVRTHPEWIIARTASQAEKAYQDGKRILVLALEGASGIIDTDEDIREFVEERGIRIITFLHLTDDHLGGVALMKAPTTFFSPWAFIKSIFRSRESDGVKHNDRGLTPDGRALVQKLIAKKVWIDLAHASDLSQNELLPLMEAGAQPPLYSHTTLRRYHRAERGISDAQLESVRKLGGILGLMPSEDYMKGTPTPQDQCANGFSRFLVQYRELSSVLGAESTMIGSDFNGLRHLAPACNTGTSLDGEKGFWNIGQSSELMKLVDEKIAPGQDIKRAKRFIDTWKRFN